MNIIKVGIKHQYKSINEATTIILDHKIYHEKVVIDKPNIIIEGNNATIIFDDYAKKLDEKKREYITFRTYATLVKAPHVTLNNLTIMNNAGEGSIVGQAVALHLYNDDIKVNNCRLIAHQDTLFCGPFSPALIKPYTDLLPKDEREHNKEFHQEFNNCYIAGTVGFIFKNCHFIKNKNTRENSVYLARPWREYGYVTFKDCYLDSHIKAEGFSVWTDTNRHLNCRFYEENSKGPGANNKSRDRKSTRLNSSHQIISYAVFCLKKKK